MRLLGAGGGQEFGAGSDLDDALLALTLFAAGRGDLDAEGFGTIEHGGAGGGVDWLVIEVKANGHGAKGVEIT